jgi:F0F1-type ATP synthase assembly protein I
MAEREQKPEQEKPSIHRSESMKLLIKAERMTQIAFVLPAAVLIGWGVGVLLDKWLHTSWIYIVGLVLGAVAGMVEAVRQALRED